MKTEFGAACARKEVMLDITGGRKFSASVLCAAGGRCAKCGNFAKEVLDRHPRHIGALNLYAVLLTCLTRYREAEQYYKRALNENNKSDATLFNYGIMLLTLNCPAEALEGDLVKRLYSILSPAETWNARGSAYLELFRNQEAVSILSARSQ